MSDFERLIAHEQHLAATRELCAIQTKGIEERAMKLLAISGNSRIRGMFEDAVNSANGSHADYLKRITETRNTFRDEPESLKRGLARILMIAKRILSPTVAISNIEWLGQKANIDTKEIAQALKDIYATLLSEVETAAKVD